MIDLCARYRLSAILLFGQRKILNTVVGKASAAPAGDCTDTIIESALEVDSGEREKK